MFHHDVSPDYFNIKNIQKPQLVVGRLLEDTMITVLQPRYNHTAGK